MDPIFERQLQLNRRQFFGATGLRLGGVALAAMAAQQANAAGPVMHPALAGFPHFAPKAKAIIYKGIAAPFINSLHIAFFGGLLLAFPFVGFFLIQFILPALREKERKYFIKAMLPATLLVGLAALFGHAGSNGPTLFGLFLLLGWLLTFLLGILQRILPFLASMHMNKGGMPPLMSELAGSGGRQPRGPRTQNS